MNASTRDQPLSTLLAYWWLIARYKWHMMVGASICLLVLTLAIAHLPNEYEATTTILVDPQQVPEKYVSPAVTADPGERLNTLTQEVLSRTRLQEIIGKFNLYADRSRTAPQEELVKRMQEHIQIQVRQGSGLQLSTFSISFQSSNSNTAAAVANELASSFIQWNVSSREQQVKGTEAFVAEELQNAKQNLEEQENKLRMFKMGHLGETPDQTAANLEAIASLRASLQATVDSCSRLEQEKVLLVRLPASANPGGSQVLNPTKRGRLELERQQVETELQHVRAGHSDRYPDALHLKRRLDGIAAELQSLPPDSTMDGPAATTTEVSATTVRLELLEKELKRLKDEQSRIQAQISSYQAKVDAAPLREQQLIELTRNYDVSKQHYQTLLDKSFNIQMAASLEQKQKGERFTVLDPARIPEKPVKPPRKMLLVVSVILSFTLPCVVAVSKEILKATITTESELKSLLPAGVRIVGHIPRVETPTSRRSELYLAVAELLITLSLFASTAWLVWQMHPSL